MLADRIEAKWIDAFCEIFERCAVKAGDTAAILSETQSRALNVHLAELALLRMGARPFHVIVPTLRKVTALGLNGTVPNHGPWVSNKSPVQTRLPTEFIVATYQMGMLNWSYTNSVAKITEPRCTNCIPQPDSAGMYQRSLWSVVNDVDQAGEARLAMANSTDANMQRMVFIAFLFTCNSWNRGPVTNRSLFGA